MPVLAEPDVLIIEEPEKIRTGGPGGGGPRDHEPGGYGGGGGDDDEFRRRRSQSGPSTGMLGLLATLISITTLFATIVIAFAARSQSRQHWDPVSMPRYLWLSTALIVASSGTLERARAAFRRLDARAYARGITATFFLGLAFMLSQALALRQLVDQGIYLRQNPHSSLFFVITGTHGVHLFGGLLGLFYLLYRVSVKASADTSTGLAAQRNALNVASVYWHFLDALWIALFLFLLLWR